MRFARTFAAAVLLSALPLTAFAQSSSSVSSLLAELSALEQQIASLSGTASTSASANAASAASSASSSGSENACPALMRTLSLGSSGTDVSSLQAYLNISPTTGYFGSLTQNAVEEWQSAHGVVSGGDASSSGYGVVGPKTRAAMESVCATGAPPEVTECLSTMPPQQDCPNGWQPVADAHGCTAYYQCTLSLPAPTPASTTLSSGTQSVATTSCPVVVQPSCSGTVVPFQTGANGCVESYECVL